MDDRTYAGKIAMYGMLIALAMIFSFVETLIPIPIPVPGVKLGLANLVTIVCLYLLGIKAAFAVSFLRILLISFTFGNVSAILFSASGGLCSLLCMMAAKKSAAFSEAGVSIIGGVSHNIGQILAAMFIIQNIGLFAYLPLLLVAGVLTGLLIGVLAALINKRIGPVLKKKKETGSLERSAL